MFKVRPAEEKDSGRILEIINKADLYYPALTLDHFFAASENEEILGCAKLEEFPDFYYLSSFAVDPAKQGKGIGIRFLNKLLKEIKKDVYLYTVKSGFFEKLGFEITAPRKDLPSKSNYICSDCHSEKCVCMVRRAA